MSGKTVISEPGAQTFSCRQSTPMHPLAGTMAGSIRTEERISCPPLPAWDKKYSLISNHIISLLLLILDTFLLSVPLNKWNDELSQYSFLSSYSTSKSLVRLCLPIIHLALKKRIGLPECKCGTRSLFTSELDPGLFLYDTASLCSLPAERLFAFQLDISFEEGD